MIPDLLISKIHTLNDPLYDQWLDLYQQAFPPGEQMLVSRHNSALRRDPGHPSNGATFLAATDGAGKLAAMARYDVALEARCAALWYLAVAPGVRNNGIGSWLYSHIVQVAGDPELGLRALVFEVELPEHADSPDTTHLAARRIAFYRRNGASLLTGIQYIQSVGWQPPMPMAIMVHPLVPLTGDEAFEVARLLLGDAVAKAGPAGLE